MSPELRRLFRSLPIAERFHVWARERSAPLAALEARVPAGRVLDLGCGHGALTARLALSGTRRAVTGVDPDARKIQWARLALGALPQVELREGRAEELLPEAEGRWDAVVVCDVLYLLPEFQWPELLGTVRRLLKPGGMFLLKEVEGDGSWRHRKALLQERLMVNVLGRTHGSGGLTLLPRAATLGHLDRAGFTTRQMLDLRRGYTTPHLLYLAEPSPR
ncbi:MAG TPA: class I SAM-dependent methyltransferase [Myxococcaceae bacterium]|nr:class I SAM-dependent methyltransferase [Myxococcaceae bacterium]